MSDYYEDMVERFFSAYVLHMEEHSNLTKCLESCQRFYLDM